MGSEHEYYVRNQSPGRESALTEQVKKHGVAIFDAKYRTTTVYQITNADEVVKMVCGDYDDLNFVCRIAHRCRKGKSGLPIGFATTGT